MTDLRDMTSNLPFDIAVEALAGLVMDNNESLSLDQLRVRPVGNLYKTAIREVLNIFQSGFDRQGRELICFDINRTSLFDSFPEMLFHSQETFEDPVEQAHFIARQRENARAFFLPVEEEFYKARIELEIKEHAALRGLNVQMAEIFGYNIKNIPQQNGERVSVFVFFLPVLSRIVGNMEFTCAVLEAVVNKKIVVKSGPSSPYKLPASLHSRAGSASLGDGFLLGDNFSDGARRLDFSVCDVNPAELEAWIPGGTMRTLLEETLLPCLLPAGENYNVDLLLSDCKGMMLGNDDLRSNILGYTTI